MAEEVQLDFENQMFIELLAEDGLVVLARYVTNTSSNSAASGSCVCVHS